jgi:DNA-binding NarL/FixJ family response regulator
MTLIRVLIADASPTYHDVVCRLLATAPEVCVLGCTTNCQETLDAVAAMHPDLVLVDTDLVRPNGLETARRIKLSPDAPLVVILARDDLPDYWAAAASIGVDGFIVKAELSERILPMLEALVDGTRTATT